MRWQMIGMVGLGLLGAKPGWAAGVYGPSGLFLHTTAYLPSSSAPTAGATAFTQIRRTAPGQRRTITWVPVFLDSRIGHRAEAGALYLYQRFEGSTLTSYGGFLKYQLLSEQQGRPAVALDGELISGDLRQSALNLVASRDISQTSRHSVHLHLGWTIHRRSDLEGPNGRFSETDNAPFAGLEIGLTRNLRFIGEDEAKLKFYPSAAAALGLMWTPGSRVGVAVGWLNTGRSEQLRPFIGVGYRVRSVD